MSVGLYFDVHVRRAISNGLRVRGVDVLIAQEDGTAEYEDSELLERSTALGRVLFTQVVYAHQLNVSIGQCITDLELIAQVSKADEWVNRTEYL